MFTIFWSDVLMPGTSTEKRYHTIPFLDSFSSGLKGNWSFSNRNIIKYNSHLIITNYDWVLQGFRDGVGWQPCIHIVFRPYFPGQRFLLLNKTFLHNKQISVSIHVQSSVQGFFATVFSHFLLGQFHF